MVQYSRTLQIYLSRNLEIMRKIIILIAVFIYHFISIRKNYDLSLAFNELSFGLLMLILGFELGKYYPY